MSTEIETKTKIENPNWINLNKPNILKQLLLPFKIYFKQFFKFFIIAIIPEFFIFGFFYIINFNIGYNFSIGFFTLELDFISDVARPYLIPLIIVGVFTYIIRSATITTISWRTIEKGKANIFWSIDIVFRQIKAVFLAALIFIFFLIIPSAFLIFAFMIGLRMPGLSWFLIFLAAGIPLLLGSRISMFLVGVTKDKLPVGTAFQKSWDYSNRWEWLKTAIILMIFGILSVIGPIILTNIMHSMFDYYWIGLIMIPVRALFYPLFDISLTLNYLTCENEAINRAFFKEDIIEYKKKQDEAYIK